MLRIAITFFVVVSVHAFAKAATGPKSPEPVTVAKDLVIQPPNDEVTAIEMPVANSESSVGNNKAGESLGGTNNSASANNGTNGSAASGINATAISSDKIAQAKETDIPVVLDAHKKAAESQSPISRALMMIGVIGILAAGGVYLFRRIAKNSNKKATATQIKILAQHHLGPKRSVAIIRVAGESLLVGVTDHNISLLKQLSLLDEDIPEETPSSFSKVFNVNNKPENSSNLQFEENRDEFSISGIKDIVHSRLKNMRTIE